MSQRRRTGRGLLLPFALLAFAGYFVFAAVQGEYGVLRRVELEAERLRLTEELVILTEEVDRMRDRTRRLSDSYLDLDLLDERARVVLGLARTDEIVIE
jgi:cell division protein FtsB